MVHRKPARTIASENLPPNPSPASLPHLEHGHVTILAILAILRATCQDGLAESPDAMVDVDGYLNNSWGD